MKDVNLVAKIVHLILILIAVYITQTYTKNDGIGQLNLSHSPLNMEACKLDASNSPT